MTLKSLVQAWILDLQDPRAPAQPVQKNDTWKEEAMRVTMYLMPKSQPVRHGKDSDTPGGDAMPVTCLECGSNILEINIGLHNDRYVVECSQCRNTVAVYSFADHPNRKISERNLQYLRDNSIGGGIPC